MSGVGDVSINFDQALQILKLAVQTARSQPAEQSGWKPGGANTFRGDHMPNDDSGNEKIKPRTPGFTDGLDPGYKDPNYNAGNGWYGRPGFDTEMAGLPKYGPHNPAITPEQAQALQLLWMVTGQDGGTVSRGHVAGARPPDPAVQVAATPAVPPPPVVVAPAENVDVASAPQGAMHARAE